MRLGDILKFGTRVDISHLKRHRAVVLLPVDREVRRVGRGPEDPVEELGQPLNRALPEFARLHVLLADPLADLEEVVHDLLHAPVERAREDHPLEDGGVEPVLNLVRGFERIHEPGDLRQDLADGVRLVLGPPAPGKFVPGLDDVALLDHHALDALDDIAAVMRLVDEQQGVVPLDPEREVELLPDDVVKEVVEVHEDHVGVPGGVHHRLVGADVAAEPGELVGPDQLGAHPLGPDAQGCRRDHLQSRVLGLHKRFAVNEVGADERVVRVHLPDLLLYLAVVCRDERSLLRPFPYQRRREGLDTLAPPVDISLPAERAHAGLANEVGEPEIAALLPDEFKLAHERGELADGADSDEHFASPALGKERGDHARFAAPGRRIDHDNTAVARDRCGRFKHLPLVGPVLPVREPVVEGIHCIIRRRPIPM